VDLCPKICFRKGKIMKHLSRISLAAALVFLASYAQAATLTGTLTDTMCSKKHMMPGKSDADCARECAKAGAKWALVSQDKTYTLDGDTSKFSTLAGQHVQVTGDITGTNVKVKQIAVAR
jgi:hypothetical protein